MDQSDQQRYVEYFQRQLLREGTDSFWVDHRAWFDANREAIAQRYREIGKAQRQSGESHHGSGPGSNAAPGLSGATSEAYAQAVESHQHSGPYDDYFSRSIFEPLVRKALAICAAGGIGLKLPVRFASSPGAEPSPAALPSISEHMMFAGQGTYAFCNYWAKVFSSAMAEVETLPPDQQRDPAAIIDKLRRGQVLVDATRLAMRYASAESVLGFGRMAQPDHLQGARVLLVQAMEIFIVGHEIGHFIAHETHPDTQGIAPGTDHKSHELECDAVGLAISTAYGVEEGNPFAFQLLGALLFFYALCICERVRRLMTDEPPVVSLSHPTHDERFRYALDFLQKTEYRKEVIDSVDYALEIAMCVGSQVQLFIMNAKADLAKDDSDAAHAPVDPVPLDARAP